MKKCFLACEQKYAILAKCIMYLRIWKGAVASPVSLINAPNPINRIYRTWNWSYQGAKYVSAIITIDIKAQIIYIVFSLSRLNHAHNKIPDHLRDHLSCVLSKHTEHLNYHSIGSNFTIYCTWGKITHVNYFMQNVKESHALCGDCIDKCKRIPSHAAQIKLEL
jgi:hypothetical protein